MDDDKLTRFLSGKNQCPLLRVDNPLDLWECLLDLRDNWPLFQFPMIDPCNLGPKSCLGSPASSLPHVALHYTFIT